MNTNDVANSLGVSSSTIKRWIKHLNIEPQRNSKGHFIFSENEYQKLKEYHLQFQMPTSVIMDRHENDEKIIKLEEKVSDLELSLYNKADSVATIQLLNHREELEELQSLVVSLTKRVNALESQLSKSRKPPAVKEPIAMDKPLYNARKRKRKIMSMMFGL